MSDTTAAAVWYVALPTGREGPLSTAQLRVQVAQKSMTGDTLVWKDGMNEWAPAAATELAELLEVRPPSPPSPPAPPPLPPLPPGTVTDTWAWALVAVPLIATFVGVVALDEWLVPALVAVGLNTVFARLDKREIDRVGREGPGLGWGIFLVPVYLFKRAKVLRRSQAPLISWLVVFAVSLLPGVTGFASDLAGNEIDAAQLEQTIATEIQAQAGVRAAVDCPDGIPVTPGHTFRCLVEVDGERAFAEVEIQNRRGDVLWEIR